VRVAIGRTEWEITFSRNERKLLLELTANDVEKYPAVGNNRRVTAKISNKIKPSQKVGIDLRNIEEKIIEESVLEFPFQPDCKPRKIPITDAITVEAPTRKTVQGIL
jgi:hypothetical protein